MALPTWMVPPGAERISVEEYLRREAAAEFKSEFYDGFMVPLWPDAPRGMAGGSAAHGALGTALAAVLDPSVKAAGCRTFSSDIKVRRMDSDAHLYPDLSIACDPEWISRSAGILANPRIVFEVLSPSTEGHDRTTKFEMYAAMPSIEAIVMVSTDPQLVEVYTRHAATAWLREAYPRGMAPLPGGIALDVDALYEGVREFL